MAVYQAERREKETACAKAWKSARTSINKRSDLTQACDREPEELDVGQKLVQMVEGLQFQVRSLTLILRVPDRGKRLIAVSVKAEHRLRVKFSWLCPLLVKPPSPQRHNGDNKAMRVKQK